MSKLILSYLFKTNLSVFRSAILEENTDKICRILDFERDFLHKDIDHEGNTALLLAVDHASPLIVRLLLDHGAEPDKTNTVDSRTSLSLLASKSYDDYNSHKAQKTLEMAKILLDYGAFVDKPIPCVYQNENNKEHPGKETPLMIAVRKKNIPFVKLLLERKADVNFTDRQSEVRSIHYAIANGDEEMFDLLANAGALDSSIVTVDKNTLLHWFCYTKENDKQISLLEKLIKKGYDINAQNWQRRTPLIIAVKNDMTNTCRILLDNEAHIGKYDCNGHQAIDLSVPGSECSKILLHAMKTERYKLRLLSTPVNKSRNTMIRKQRIGSARRFTTEICNTDNNNNETKDQDNLSKHSQEDKQNTSTFHAYLSLNDIKDNSGIETKYERVWEKSFKPRQTTLLLKGTRKGRALSVDTEDTSRF
ncbi:unnamed protein product [Adineta steineri]|uniref:Ankyrin repeat protein n=1 Tax=Adineta steineri TaxID=433720 RepID=A0A813MK55_9BILA|nr:unnamed protein product [Adineta steineri]CAF3936706.1 unnamed protein product [Adineta steineri]